MDFRRIDRLPPYVFAEVNKLKTRARHRGEDIVDLGFGNPDMPSAPFVADKLVEAARNPKNHRYSQSRGIPNLRKALVDRYMRRFGVELDPEMEVINTIGAKEGLSHLMWSLVQPGDVGLVPAPSYSIHIYAAILSGAEVHTIPLTDTPDTFFAAMERAFVECWPKPRVILTSFPHNTTTMVVDLAFWQRLVAFAKEHNVFLINDFPYADIAFDGYDPPSILQVPGAKEVAVELYALTKSHSMAGWRVGFVAGNVDAGEALAKLKSYLDYGTFQPIQIAAIGALNEGDDYVKEINDRYWVRRDTLIDGLARAGWEIESLVATMFVWAPLPEQYRDMGSLEFTKLLLKKAKVAVSPGVGFGPGGEGFARFALVENKQRILQAVRSTRQFLEAG